MRALWARKRIPTREARKGSSAKEVTGNPSRSDPPRPSSDGVGGTSIVAAPPCIGAKRASPIEAGTEGSEKVPPEQCPDWEEHPQGLEIAAYHSSRRRRRPGLPVPRSWCSTAASAPYLLPVQLQR